MRFVATSYHCASFESNNGLLAFIHKDTKYTSNLQLYSPYLPFLARLQTVTHPTALQSKITK